MVHLFTVLGMVYCGIFAVVGGVFVIVMVSIGVDNV